MLLINKKVDIQNAKLPNSQREVRKNVQVDVATMKEHDTRECSILNIFTLNDYLKLYKKKDTLETVI